MKRLTTKEFIKRSKLVHKNKYDYSLAEYKNRRIPVIIICKIHGPFEQFPDLHYRQQHGCPYCGGTFRLTTLEFIERAKKIHNNRYNYSETMYKTLKTKVKIGCPQHGFFWQLASIHLRGSGCPQCYKEQSTKDYFIQKAVSVHGDKYDYSQVKYINSRTRIEIICSKHGSFWQRPNNHIQGRGCKICAIKAWVPPLKINQKQFIKRARKTHQDKYDYSKVEYIDIFTRIEIICSKHGSFWQRPSDHIFRTGCPKCGFEQATISKSIDISEFLERAKDIHQNLYDYSKIKSTYKNLQHKVKIGCPQHGFFWQLARAHIQGKGCPKCNNSFGEKKVSEILTSMNIDFIEQKTFDNCKRKISLRFDFYFERNNKKILIEYDGIQHFESIDCFGGYDTFRAIKERDNIKNKFAKENGFILIRIPYTEFDNIETILKTKIAEA